MRAKRMSRWVFGSLFVVAGLNHFASTSFYVGIMPPYLPWHVGLVYASGIAEMAFGALFLFPQPRVFAAWGLIALLIAVFPANLHMALHPELYPWAPAVGLWLRLPVQGLLILWAWWYTRPDTSPPRASPGVGLSGETNATAADSDAGVREAAGQSQGKIETQDQR